MVRKKDKSSSKGHRGKWKGVRSFWSGTISFGLVNVPVHLFPANRSSDISLRMLDQDGTPLVRRFYCPKEDRDIHPEHIIRGYELDDGEYVIVRDEELEDLEPEKSREIDLRKFVSLAEVSPLYFDRAYYLTPAGDSNKAYRLLAAVMEETRKAGIATFVMRDREYLIAILAQGGILRAQTMRFADELRSPEDIGLPEKEKPNAKLVRSNVESIQALSKNELDTDFLRNETAEAMRKLIERKRKQKKNRIRVSKRAKENAEEENGEAGPDLLESIRRSLQQKDEIPDHEHPRNSQNGKLEKRSKDELYEQAQKLDIQGRSKLTKEELIQAIRRKRG